MNVLATIVALALVPASKVQPPSPYIDIGACPFECCTYRNWHAERKVVLFNRPNGRRIGELDKGEWVEALTGETHSIPLRVVASRDVAEAGIHPGDVFYVLRYEGEFYWKIWYRGKTFDAEAGDSRFPKTTWWAQVRHKGGSVGWVKAAGGAFSNQDQCGGNSTPRG
jgi:hypothetical protein